MTTHAKAGIHKPNTRYVFQISKLHVLEPRNVQEALAHTGWNGGVSEEMNTIHMLHTWTHVPVIEDMNILGCKWVHKIKSNSDGTIGNL